MEEVKGSIMDISKVNKEEIGNFLVQGILKSINSTNQDKLPAAIKSVMTENHGMLHSDNIQIDAKIFLKIGNFEGNLEIKYPPLTVE
jgi:hypothetical protein